MGTKCHTHRYEYDPSKIKFDSGSAASSVFFLSSECAILSFAYRKIRQLLKSTGELTQSLCLHGDASSGARFARSAEVDQKTTVRRLCST